MSTLYLESIPRYLKESLILLNGLLALIIVIGMMVLSIPLLIYRWGLAHFVKRYHQGKIGELVTPKSAAMGVELLQTGKKNGSPPRSTIVVTITMDGKVTVEEVKELLNTKWFTKTSSFPELRQYVDSWKGFLFWKDDLKFNLENHLHSHSIEGDSDAEVEENVCLFIEKLLNTPFQPKRSPWNFYIVNNYRNAELSKQSVNGEGLTLILFQFHHCIGDGYSILNAIMEGLLNTSLSKISLPSPKKLGVESWTQKFRLPWRLFRDWSHLWVFLYSPRTPLHLPYLGGARGSFIYMRNPSPISIQNIKMTKIKHGATFNGVLLSGLSAAIAKTLQRLQNGRKLKGVDSIPFLVPIPLPGTRPDKLMNYVTITNVELPVTPELDPLERLRRTERQLEVAKKNTLPLLSHLYLQWLGSLPTVLIRVLSRNLLFPAGFSSFPGPGIEIEWKGKKVLALNLVAGLLIPGVSGLGFFLLSFRNEVRIGVCVDDKVMNREEIRRMISCVCDEFDVLLNLPSSKLPSLPFK